MVRPRSEEARRKALAAAAELIVERGVVNLTIEEVAARSGVAKTTIYRHWPERTSLIVDTVNVQLEHIGTPDTGSLRGDLEAYFGAAARVDLSGRFGQMMPCLVEAANRHPDMGELLERIGEARSQVIVRILGQARRRGELRAALTDLDIDDLVGVIAGPFVFQKYFRRRPLTPEYIQACLDVIVAGLTSPHYADA